MYVCVRGRGRDYSWNKLSSIYSLSLFPSHFWMYVRKREREGKWEWGRDRYGKINDEMEPCQDASLIQSVFLRLLLLTCSYQRRCTMAEEWGSCKEWFWHTRLGWCGFLPSWLCDVLYCIIIIIITIPEPFLFFVLFNVACFVYHCWLKKDNDDDDCLVWFPSRVVVIVWV